MRITQRTVRDVVILNLEGEILIGCYDPDDDLRAIVAALAVAGRLKVLMNLAAVTYTDSAFLGEVVRSYTVMKRKGGILKLLSPGKQLRDLLQETRLATVFEIYYDEEAAIRSFA